jgi:HSP20 family protein
MDLDRTFSDLMQRMLGWRSGDGQKDSAGELVWVPSIDVLSRGDDLVIRAEIPGVDPERDIDITVQDRTLSIRGERKQERRTEDDRFFRTETFYGSFLRTVPLPTDVKPDDIHATYRDGILEIVIPKAAEQSSSKRIPVSVETENGSGRSEESSSSSDQQSS